MEKIVMTGYLGADAKVVSINHEERFIQASLAPVRIKDREQDAKFLRWYQLNFSLHLKPLLPSLLKGTLVAVTGDLRIGAYVKDGKGVPTATVYVNTIEVLSRKSDKEDDGHLSQTSNQSNESYAPDEELPF